MKASQLRDLTRKYAAGGLAREEYIAERKRLIDGIVSGEIELRYRNLIAGNKANSESGRKRWLVMAGSLLLVGMLLVAVLAYFLDDNNDHKTLADGASPSVNAPDPGVDLLRDFARSGQWSNNALETLETNWQLLTPFQQESARRSAAYRQLRHETNQRIIEQEALLAAGEMDALLLAGRLREFARKLGFSGD